MPIPLASQIVECTVVGRQAGQMIMNTYHYYTNGDPIPGTLAWAAAAAADWSALTAGRADFMAMFNPLYEVRSVSVQLIWPTRYARGPFIQTPPVAGTRAGTITPPGTQWSATTLTDATGASSHGGNRYAGLNVADTDLGEITGAFGIVANDGVAPLYTDIALQGVALTPLVYNRNDPESSNPIANFIIEDQIRTMRRRVVGRGK